MLVLRHGEQTLASACFLEVEVDFVEQYESEPRFSEVELFLRSRGFEFYAFSEYGSRPAHPCAPTVWKGTKLRQWL